MKRISFVLPAILILAHTLASQSIDGIELQANPADSEIFPEELLNGRADFNFALFFEGDLRGNLGPAEGIENLGGFARRASYWREFRRRYGSRPFMRLDGGSLFEAATGAQAETVNRWMLEAIYRAGLDAILLSAWDLPVWRNLAERASEGRLPETFLELPLVSTNVEALTPRFPVLRRYVTRRYEVETGKGAAPVRIAVMGLLYDSGGKISREEFRIREPVEAAREAVSELVDKTDYRIALTDADVGHAISLAVAVPELNLILVAHNYLSISEVQKVGETLVVIPVNEGRMLNEVRMNFVPGLPTVDLESRFVPMEERIPDDPAMGKLVLTAKEELSKQLPGVKEPEDPD